MPETELPILFQTGTLNTGRSSPNVGFLVISFGSTRDSGRGQGTAWAVSYDPYQTNVASSHKDSEATNRRAAYRIGNSVGFLTCYRFLMNTVSEQTILFPVGIQSRR